MLVGHYGEMRCDLPRRVTETSGRRLVADIAREFGLDVVPNGRSAYVMNEHGRRRDRVSVGADAGRLVPQGSRLLRVSSRRQGLSTGGEVMAANMREAVSDVLVAAFEGGITYWADAVEVDTWPQGALYASDVPSLGGVVYVVEAESHDDDDIDGKKFPLRYSDVLRGIRLEAKRRGMGVQRWIENHDAGDADNAVQFAIFGELVYG